MTTSISIAPPTSTAGVDAAVVVEQVLACRLVADVHSGRDGSIRSGEVVGVRVDRSALVVGVVGLPGVDSVETVRAVRSAVTHYPPELSLCVSVESRSRP